MKIKCSSCGAALPQEADFCPYCMEKLAVEDPIVVKTTRKKRVLTILSITIVIIIGILTILYFAGVIGAQSQKDYSDYIGTWIFEDADETQDGLTAQTGNLTILSSENNTVTFDILFVSAPPNNRIAEVVGITAGIIGDKATFTFDDDGHGNKGEGFLKFENDKIYVEIEITEENPEALWYLGPTTQYYRRAEMEVSNLENYIGRDYSSAALMLGDGVPEEEFDEAWIYYRYDDVEIMVDIRSNIIIAIRVDYGKTDNKKRYTVANYINGISTYETVYNQLGPPDLEGREAVDEEGNEFDMVGYYLGDQDEFFVKIYFSEEKDVVITYCYDSVGI